MTVFKNNPQHAPIVSICCVTYNHARYIAQTLSGFLAQETSFPFEILVGDDASTDETVKIIEEFKARYPGRITLFRRSSNIGPRRNFAQVTASARGKYIALCDGDDYWTDACKLQIQVDFLEANPEFTICCHSYKVQIGDTIIPSPPARVFDTLDFQQYASELPNIQNVSVMFRNIVQPLVPVDMIDEVGGTFFIFLRVAEHGRIKYLDLPMATYRIHSAGVWAGKSIRAQGDLAIQNIESMFRYYCMNTYILKALRKPYARTSATYFLHSAKHFNLADSLHFLTKGIEYGGLGNFATHTLTLLSDTFLRRRGAKIN